ncbi:MAG: glycoside hydrolase family 97 protein [Gammaproteobacteria bacterium]
MIPSRTMAARVLALLIFLISASAIANDVASIESPGAVLRVTLAINGEGRVSYRVDRKGQPVVGESRLGFILADAPKLERNFTFVDSRSRSVDDTWEQPWGERRFVRDRHNELRIRLREAKAPVPSPAARELTIVFRVFDDGFGLRYEFPEQAALRAVNITDELTEFDLIGAETAWWIPAGEWNRYEYLDTRSRATEVGQAHTPITFRRADGLHMAVHEAALVDYSAMWLRRVEGTRFKATLSPAAQGARVKRSAPFATPWRTLQIADTAARLYTSSDLILNLNEPNALGDVSWVKPHKYVGIWWSLHLDTESWASGPRHGATTANARRYIDFAAANGFRSVLIEGWNRGWDEDWFANGDSFSFTEPYPDFDLEGLAAYARKKGVRLMGHHETSGFASHYEGQLAAALDQSARLGIEAIKTGYVADAGGAKFQDADGSVRFEWHDGQAMSRHHLQVVTEAAKRRIAINPHEPIKDTGLRRTYPNWVAREGARGMEYNAWGAPPNPPEHEANLFFTRMLSGPMDFTPGVLSLKGRNGQAFQSTIAKQLALYLVVYSPIQMAADLPENYARFPGPFQFIKDVPVDWQETLVLDGEVGDFVTVARKDRGSEDWYVGGVTDEVARTLTVPLEFLTAGKRYRAQIYRDGADASWDRNPFAILIEKREVKRGDRLEIPVASGGGFAVRLEALQ